MQVKDIQSRTDLQFISDLQDTKGIKEYFMISDEYDSFFCKIENGEYIEVYGIHGNIPYLDKELYPIRIKDYKGDKF